MNERWRDEGCIVCEVKEARGAESGQKSLGCFDCFGRGRKKRFQGDELVVVSKVTIFGR